MSNPAFKPSEGKREEFRKYLEKNGVMDALTKVLVNLYEEVDKPEDALEYIRDKLAVQAGIETLSQMKSKTDELQFKVEQLEQEMEQMKIAQEGGEPPITEALIDEEPLEDGENPPPIEIQGSGPIPIADEGSVPEPVEAPEHPQ